LEEEAVTKLSWQVGIPSHVSTNPSKAACCSFGGVGGSFLVAAELVKRFPGSREREHVRKAQSSPDFGQNQYRSGASSPDPDHTDADSAYIHTTVLSGGLYDGHLPDVIAACYCFAIEAKLATGMGLGAATC
jgi:hypothetical protein